MQFQVSNTNCPRCHNPISLATIEPHPSQVGLALHNYECVNCGPVVTKIILLREDAEKPGQVPQQRYG